MAARQLRLIGPAAMLDAIGKTRVHFLAAEMEIGLAGMAHRPAADPVIEIEQAGFFGHFRAGLGRHQTARRGRRDRCLLIARSLPEESARTDRDDALLRLGARHGRN